MALRQKISSWLRPRSHREQRLTCGFSPEVIHARPIEAWIEAKTGKSARQVTTRDLLKIPRRNDLRYEQPTSVSGGRLDRHLLHLSEQRSDDLLARGDAFIENTPADDSRTE